MDSPSYRADVRSLGLSSTESLLLRIVQEPQHGVLHALDMSFLARKLTIRDHFRATINTTVTQGKNYPISFETLSNEYQRL